MFILALKNQLLVFPHMYLFTQKLYKHIFIYSTEFSVAHSHVCTWTHTHEQGQPAPLSLVSKHLNVQTAVRK